MSDEQLCELERRWKTTGTVENETAFLQEQMRVGGALAWAQFHRFKALRLPGLPQLLLPLDESDLVSVRSWIRWAGQGESEVEVRADVELAGPDLFSGFAARFSEGFGEPDYPGNPQQPWDEWLGLRDCVLSVWNFDHYQLSLRLEPEGQVMLQLHNNASASS